MTEGETCGNDERGWHAGMTGEACRNDVLFPSPLDVLTRGLCVFFLCHP